MQRCVRLQDGVPVEFRDLDLASLPPHKAALWAPVVEKAAPSHAAGEVANRREGLVDGKWVVSYDVVKHSDDVLVQMIKSEAQRRIIALTGAQSFEASLAKQSNALMRATRLVNKKASGQTLTLEEESEAAYLDQFAAAIEMIRAKSNALEIALPVDFNDDKHWA